MFQKNTQNPGCVDFKTNGLKTIGTISRLKMNFSTFLGVMEIQNLPWKMDVNTPSKICPDYVPVKNPMVS